MSLVIQVDFTPRRRKSEVTFAYGYGNGVKVYVYGDRTVTVGIKGQMLTSDMFHDLPQGRWSSMLNPKFQVVGQIPLDSQYFDLLMVEEATGELYAASVLNSRIDQQSEPQRAFIKHHQQSAPTIKVR